MRIAVIFHCVLFQSAGFFDAVIIYMERGMYMNQWYSSAASALQRHKNE